MKLSTNQCKLQQWERRSKAAIFLAKILPGSGKDQTLKQNNFVSYTGRVNFLKKTRLL